MINNEEQSNNSKKSKKKDKKKICLPKNVMREFFNSFASKDLKDKILGSYYLIFHCLIMFFGTVTILFSNNILYLIVILLCVSVDSLCIVILHDCPLTLLEKKYLGSSMAELREKHLKETGIVYKEDHCYETQIELLINLTCLIVLKILVLIFLDTFNISKPNYPATFMGDLIRKYYKTSI